MLSAKKFNQVCQRQKMTAQQLASHLVRGGRTAKEAVSAIRNWQKGLMTPKPNLDDVRRLAEALGVEVQEISEWRAVYRYAPMSPRKVHLVTQLIQGREVQDALDVLQFTRKRAAEAVRKVLQSAVANADEQEADVENLVVTEARVDPAGRRIGTKAWRAKDRGRAHPIRKEASHIVVTVSQL
jgi:large subunit ribosomal protein L22